MPHPPEHRGEPAAPTTRRGFLRRMLAVVAGGAALGVLARRDEAEAAAVEPYTGEIMLFAGSFAPRGWARCDGQLLPISQNQALFSLLGTTYGGNGTTTFALPDLRGRAPIHAGQGPGLTDRPLGESGGTESHALTAAEMPVHNHPAFARSLPGTSAHPSGLLPARDPSGVPHYGPDADATLHAGAVGLAGAGLPHDNMPPYLALTFCICLTGVFPPQP